MNGVFHVGYVVNHAEKPEARSARQGLENAGVLGFLMQRLYTMYLFSVNA